MLYHDENSIEKDMISDIADKHCPDSIRKSAYKELEHRGISKEEAQDLADRKYGDYYG